MSLRHKTIVITGGTSDVGISLTLHLAGLGADVVMIDKNPEKARRITTELEIMRERDAKTGRAGFIEADLTNADQAKEAMSRAIELFGGMEALIAGLQTDVASSVGDENYLKEFDRLNEVNTKSAVYSTWAVLPYMKARKKGRVIYLISDLVRWGMENESLSAVTRGGLIYYARALARELAPNNITVNCVSLGPTEEYLIARDPKAESIKAVEEQLSKAIPMARTLKAREVVEAVSFLCTPGSDAITGQTIAVNGGLTMF